MTAAPQLHIRTITPQDPRLGRHCVHDPASRNYEHQPRTLTAGPDVLVQRWRHRVWNPTPLPEQPNGCCTGVDQCVKANAKGNRLPGVILGLDTAQRVYSRATELDGIDGQYQPTDTGSSSLAACKAAQEQHIIDRYEWIFAGPRAVLQTLRNRCVGVGTWWTADMFRPDPNTLLVKPTGGTVGGHQWTLIGWEPELRAFEGLCWWGPTFGRRGLFRIGYDHLGELLADDGDAHVTYRHTT